MTHDEQLAALKQAYAGELAILFAQHLNAVKIGDTTVFASDLATLNQAFDSAAALIPQ